jgi:putative pre-16S rRNA nuclease
LNTGCAIAIDHGTKRTGFAVTDPLRISIEPLDLFRGDGAGEELLDFIAGLLADRSVGVFVVGWPLNMDGSTGPRARDVQAFYERLGTRFPGIELARVDERLSTKEAEARLAEAGYRGAARKARRDSWSAVVLLEDWIRAGEPR